MKINGSDIGLDWRCAVYLRGVLRNNDIRGTVEFTVWQMPSLVLFSGRFN